MMPATTAMPPSLSVACSDLPATEQMNDFEGRFAALRVRFRDRLYEERDWFATFAAGDSAFDIEVARDRSHRLCGIAGSMDYGAVSDAACALERILMQNGAQSDFSACIFDLLATLDAALA